MGEGVICVNVGVRSVRSRGFLASYLTSDLKVMSVPLILFVGRDHALILVEVGECHICMSVRVNVSVDVSVKRVRWRGYLVTYPPSDI